MRGLNLLPLLPALWPHWHHAGQMIWRIYGPCFSGHWPSPSSSSSSSLSLATTERDAADGQPAFRHHQCRLGDGRRAAWPDRRKRQGELNLFFFPLFEWSAPNPRDLPAAWPDRTANGGGSYHPSSGSSLIPPSSGTSVFLSVHCSLWLQSRRGDRYSSHHLFNVIPEYELYKMIPLVFNKPRRLNWAHLGRRVWSVVPVWIHLMRVNAVYICRGQCEGRMVMMKVGRWWLTAHYSSYRQLLWKGCAF